MLNSLTLLPAILCVAVAYPDEALAHGGAYRGPDDLVPRAEKAPPPFPGLPPNRPGGRRFAPDFTLWYYWWEFNKAPFLARQAGSSEAGSLASSDAGLADEDRKRILDAITKVLADPGNNREIHSAGLMALAKVARRSAPPGTFRAFVSNPDQEKSETAVIAMGVAGLQEAVPELLALAADNRQGRTLSGRKLVHFRTRAFACYALGLIARQSQDIALQGKIFAAMKGLASQSRSVRVDIRTAALTAIRLLRLDGSERGKQLLAQAVGFLRAFIDKSDKEEMGRMRAHAVAALASLVHRYGEEWGESKRKLIQLLDERKTNSYIQQSAVLGLGLLARPDDAEVGAALRRYSRKGKDQQARYFTCISLGRMGGSQNKTFLAQPFLHPTDPRSIQKLELPWRALGLAILEEKARRVDPEHSADLPLAKGIHRYFRDVRIPTVAAALSLTLGVLRYEPATVDIVDRFKKIEPGRVTAGYFCLALGLMHDKGSQDLIRSLVDPASRRVALLRQGSCALGQLDDRASAPRLIRILGHERMLLSVSGAAAMALRRISDKPTIDTLLELAGDGSQPSLPRAFAVVTLGLLADRKPFPWNHAFLAGLNYRAMVETLSGAQRNGILDIL